MTGIVVQNTATNPGGEPLAFEWVHIALITGTPGGAGYLASSDILTVYTVRTDATGHWSATLNPNSLINPANTYYQVTEGSAVSNFSVPASGGPYNLSQLLVTPPPTPAAPGITGLQVAVGGVVEGVRPGINLIAGTNVTLSGADDPTTNFVDVTINASGGSSGTATWLDGLGLGLATAYPPYSGYGSTQSAGDLVWCLVTATKNTTISTLGIQVTQAGVTPSGVNGLALATEAGVIIDQTGDMSAAFATVGFAEGAMSGSHPVVAGTNYYLGVNSHFSAGQPKFAATGTASTSNIPPLNGHLIAIFKSLQAGFQNFVPSAYTLNSGLYIMYAR